MISSVVRVGAVAASVLGVTAPDVLGLLLVLFLTVGFLAGVGLVIAESAR